MTTNLAAALKKLRAVTNEFYDALELELRGVTTVPTAGPVTPQRAPVPTSGVTTGVQRPVQPTAVRRPAPATRPAAPLPTPALPGRKATVLDDQTRAENLPAAKDVALKVLKLIGTASPTLVDGVRGQLALEHIPCDELLVTQAIDLARKELPQ